MASFLKLSWCIMGALLRGATPEIPVQLRKHLACSYLTNKVLIDPQLFTYKMKNN